MICRMSFLTGGFMRLCVLACPREIEHLAAKHDVPKDERRAGRPRHYEAVRAAPTALGSSLWRACENTGIGREETEGV